MAVPWAAQLKVIEDETNEQLRKNQEATDAAVRKIWDDLKRENPGAWERHVREEALRHAASEAAAKAAESDARLWQSRRLVYDMAVKLGLEVCRNPECLLIEPHAVCYRCGCCDSCSDLSGSMCASCEEEERRNNDD